jgi:hypothetical protein
MSAHQKDHGLALKKKTEKLEKHKVSSINMVTVTSMVFPRVE